MPDGERFGEPVSAPPDDGDEPDFRTPAGRLLRPRTRAEIRLSGLAGVVGGLVLLGLTVVFGWPRLPIGNARILFVPGFASTAWFALLIGSYRLAFASMGEDARQGILWSLLRITFGVLVSVGSVLVILAALTLTLRAGK